jgi:hypothetical protein
MQKLIVRVRFALADYDQRYGKIFKALASVAISK